MTMTLRFPLASRRFLKNREGATIIEFAIVAPVFFLLIFGIIEFSLVMYATSVLENAATAAARTGITGNAGGGGGIDNADYSRQGRVAAIRQTASRLSNGLLREEEVIVETLIFEAYDRSDATLETGDIANPNYGCGNEGVQYNVSYEWNIFTPLIGQFFEGGDYVIRSAVIVKNEDFDDALGGIPLEEQQNCN